jgi:hypothetical protein
VFLCFGLHSVICFLAWSICSLSVGHSLVQLANILIFKPQMLLKWHRELVQRKWTFANNRRVD